jgi:hypothetical protein
VSSLTCCGALSAPFTARSRGSSNPTRFRGAGPVSRPVPAAHLVDGLPGIDVEKMKIQIAIAFSEAKKLNDDQIIKLIKCQARKLRFTDWEVNYLCQMCLEKQCVEKGFGAVFEFAGYVDRMGTLLGRRNDITIALGSHYRAFSTSQFDANAFVDDIKRLAEVNAKLFHCLCQFRKLNWNPRPIFSDFDANNPLSSLFPENEFGYNSRIPLQTVLREEAYELISFAHENEIDLLGCNMTAALAVLLAPIMDPAEFGSVLIKICNPEVLEKTVLSSQYGDKAKHLMNTFSELRAILNHEDRIEKIWMCMEQGNDKHGKQLESIAEVIYRYPILRIPYTGIACSCESLKWFSKAQNDYRNALLAVAAGIKDGIFATKSPEKVEGLEQRLLSLPRIGGRNKKDPKPRPKFSSEERSDDTVEADDDNATSTRIPMPDENLVKEVFNTVLQRRIVKPIAGGMTFSGKSVGGKQASSSEQASSTSNSSNPNVPPSSLDSARPGTLFSDRLVLKSAQWSDYNIQNKANSSWAADDSRENNLQSPATSEQDELFPDRSTAQPIQLTSAQPEGQSLDFAMSGPVPNGISASAGEACNTTRSTDSPNLPKAVQLSVPTLEQVNKASPTHSTFPAVGSVGSSSFQSSLVPSASGLRPEQFLFLQQQQTSQVQFEKMYGYSPYQSPVTGTGVAFARSPALNTNLDDTFDVSDMPLGSPGYEALTERTGDISDIVQRGRGMSDQLFSSAQRSSNGSTVILDFADRRPSFGVLSSDADGGTPPTRRARAMSAGRARPPNLNQRSPSSSFNSGQSEIAPGSFRNRPRSASDHYVAAGAGAGGRRDSNHGDGSSSSRSGSQRHASNLFNSKHLETLNLLTSLANPVHRGECLADSQVVRVAFRYLDDANAGQRIVYLAAKKIKLWWRIVYPRRKFRIHMFLRSVVTDLVFAIADKAVMDSIVRHRRRRKLLRHGSAVRIQKLYRQYRFKILQKEKLEEAVARARTTDLNIKKWVKTTRLLLTVYRYIRKWHRKLLYRARRLQKPTALRLPTFVNFGEFFLIKLREYRLKAALTFISNANSAVLTRHTARAQMVKEREKAAVKVQGLARNILARGSKKRRDLEREMMHRIKSLLYKVVYLYRKKKRNACMLAAMILQKIIRGFLCRAQIHREVRSGMLLNTAWRRHKAAKLLRHNLRRVERPVKIVLHGLRHIHQSLLHNEDVRVKISVWWHPLLHIVSESDFATIISHKHPQFVTYSKLYSATQESETKEEMQIEVPQQLNASQPSGHRRMSSMVSNLFSSSAGDSANPQPVPASPISFESAANVINKLVKRHQQTMALKKKKAETAAVDNGQASEIANGATGSGGASPTSDKKQPRFRGLASQMLTVDKAKGALLDKRRQLTPLPSSAQTTTYSDFKVRGSRNSKSGSAAHKYQQEAQEADEPEYEAAAMVKRTMAVQNEQSKQAKLDLATKMLQNASSTSTSPVERKRQLTPLPSDRNSPIQPGSSISKSPQLGPLAEAAEEKSSEDGPFSGFGAASHRSKSPQALIVGLTSNKSVDDGDEDEPDLQDTVSAGVRRKKVRSSFAGVSNQPSLSLEHPVGHNVSGRSNSLPNSPASVYSLSTVPSVPGRGQPPVLGGGQRKSVSIAAAADTRSVEDQVLEAMLEEAKVAPLVKQMSMKKQASFKRGGGTGNRSGSFFRNRLSSFLARNTRRPSSVVPGAELEEDDPDDDDDDDANTGGDGDDAFGPAEQIGGFNSKSRGSIMESLTSVFAPSRRTSTAYEAQEDYDEYEVAAPIDTESAVVPKILATSEVAAVTAPTVNASRRSSVAAGDDDNKLFTSGLLANKAERDVPPDSHPQERHTHRRSTRHTAAASHPHTATSRATRTSKRGSLMSSVSKAITRMSGVRVPSAMPKGRTRQSRLPKMYCHFEDETIRIPGCHGNSVVRFDFLAGE